MSNYDPVLRQFLDLASIQSVSFKERAIMDYLKNYLTRLGFDYYEDKACEKINGEAGNLICKIRNSKTKATNTYLMAAHVDTITPSCQTPFVKKGRVVSNNDRILGADNRVGVTVLLQILSKIAQQKIPYPNLDIVFLVAEEVGLLGSKNLDFTHISSRYGFNFDCSAQVGQVVVTATAKLSFELTVLGHESHSAVAPEKGISAIVMASKIISEIDLPSKKNDTIFNIGKICGGEKTNIIPGKVLINGEIRSFQEETIKEYLKHINTICESVGAEFKGKYKLAHYREYGPYQLDKKHEPVRITQRAAQNAGIPFKAIKYLAGSDANIFNEKGIPTVNIGLGYVNNHSSDEYIEIKDLKNAIELGIQITQIAASQ